MTVFSRHLLPLIFLSLTPHAASAQAIKEFPLLHWGMTKADVQKAYSEMQDHYHAFDSKTGKVIQTFGLPLTTHANCNMGLSLLFNENDALDAIIFDHLAEGASDCGEAVTSELTRRYGKPEDSFSLTDRLKESLGIPSTNMMKMPPGFEAMASTISSWKTRDGNIDLTVKKSGPVAINYTSPGYDDGSGVILKRLQGDNKGSKVGENDGH